MCKRCVELEAEVEALKERLAWADGRRGKVGRVRAPGMSVTETRYLRRLTATGFLYNGIDECVQRHVSNIKRKLREQGVDVEIKTLVNQGYQLVAGEAELVQFLSDVNPDAAPYTGSTIPGAAAVATCWR